MAMNEELINFIETYIKENNNQEITGDILQKVLTKIVKDIKSNIFTINASFDLTELDNYIPQFTQNMYKVMSNDNSIFYGLLLVYPIMIGGRGFQVFIGSKHYNQSSGGIGEPTIIWRTYDNSWTSWKPLQALFISDDGSKPASELDETMYAPSMRLFNEKIGYNKIAEWSGIVVHNVVVENPDMPPPLEIFLTTAKDRYYDDTKKTFLTLYEGKYYGNYKYEDFQQNPYKTTDFVANFTKSIFKGLNGSVWIADSESSIKRIDGGIIYKTPGDISTLKTGSGNIQNILGSLQDFSEAVNDGKLIASKGLMLTTKVQGSSYILTSISYTTSLIAEYWIFNHDGESWDSYQYKTKQL